MNFQEFRNTFFRQKVFSTGDIAKTWSDFSLANLLNWQRKGYLLKLRNTWYAFPDALKTEADLYFLANRLQRPSYISLETALRFYNFIPESVFSITSVTTAKPVEWRTPIGHFAYRSVKPAFFFGYQLAGTQPDYLLADPEKALLDLLYFKANLSEAPDFEGLRLNVKEISERLNPARFDQYLTHIASPTLEKRGRKLLQFLGL